MESKEERYKLLIKQAGSLIDGEPDLIASLSNLSAAIHETFNFMWCGFYIIRNNILVLGPFQGHVACTRIGFGKGVCGTAWKEKQTILVDNVLNFEGYIACSSLAKSEIVVPIFKDGGVVAVIDIDSDMESCFDDVDKQYLENLSSLISPLF